MLYASYNILPHLQEYRVPSLSVEIHNGFNELRAEWVALPGRRGLARAQVVDFRREAVLPPHAVVVMDYTHGCVAVAWKTRNTCTWVPEIIFNNGFFLLCWFLNLHSIGIRYSCTYLNLVRLICNSTVPKRN